VGANAVSVLSLAAAEPDIQLLNLHEEIHTARGNTVEHGRKWGVKRNNTVERGKEGGTVQEGGGRLTQ
jgi:hypothetical protein